MKKVKTREKYLQSIEEPNYKLGILFLFPILEKREKEVFPTHALSDKRGLGH